MRSETVAKLKIASDREQYHEDGRPERDFQQTLREESLNDTYKYLLRFIPYSSELAVAPKDVATAVAKKGVHDLDPDYIREALAAASQRRRRPHMLSS